MVSDLPRTQGPDLGAWTPRRIVEELDQFIVGQAEAKRSVAIALRNRYRRQLAPDPIREEILPGNILMIGPTGVGKTEIARRLARIAGAPFLKVEATKFTEVGYVGRDVESIVRDLTEIGVAMLRQEMAESVRVRAEKQVEHRLLNLLVPRNQRSRLRHDDPERASELAEWEERRRQARDDLRAGRLDERMVDIDVTEQHGAGFDLISQLGLEGQDMGLAEALEGMMPKRKKRRHVSIAEARRLLVQEETRRMIDMDDVVGAAIRRVESHGIVFLDEIDKVCSSGGAKGSPDVSREGVQRDLLPIVEGCAVTTKYGVVRTDHILFIAAGAFHLSRPADLLPELQGRLPIRVELSKLDPGDYHRILTEPRNSIILQQQALLASEGVRLEFTDDALHEIAEIAFRVNETTENIGARRLQTLLAAVLEDVLFEVPELGRARIVVDAERVRLRLARIARDKDLSSYIL